nr:PDZ domain-containing protein 4 isoform X2 [Danio rerio]|eukprot:XP_021327735.1 PDZ domain-containing protein 4 isoform X2 [Danio rerio]
MAITDCVDNGTQTDISFQNFLNGDRGSYLSSGSPKPPHSPLLALLVEPYLLNELGSLGQEYSDTNDYFSVTNHEADQQEELEYEEVELYKSSQQDKLGLTVCYRTDDEEDQGIYVGEVNPNSIAAKDGRIRKGDRILQINGIEVQNREEAVAILTREDSTNFSLLLARPEIETDTHLDPEELDCELPVGMSVDTLNTANLPGLYHFRQQRLQAGIPEEALHRETPMLSLATLNNSQELDSGVGRTDESTKNEESSEHDILLGDEQTSATNTNATNTPGSLRKFRPGRGGGGGSETPSPLFPLRELHLSTDSLDCGSVGGGYLHDPVSGMVMPGLTEEECERYKQLLEIKCRYEKRIKKVQQVQEEQQKDGERQGQDENREEEGTLDENSNENLTPHEMALLEEEMRHLEFKCRNILRAQKMQQLRERCLKAWLMEEETSGRVSAEPQGSPLHELSDINELPEKERSDKDSTSAYNTGGESSRSPPMVSEHRLPVSQQDESTSPLPSRHRDRPMWSERGRASLNSTYSPSSYKKFQTITPMNQKFCSLSREGTVRRMPDGMAQNSSSRVNNHTRNGGRSAESSPYFTRRRHSNCFTPERYQSCMHLGSSHSESSGPLDRAVEGESEAPIGGSDQEGHCEKTLGSLPHPSPVKLSLALPLPLSPASPRMEWKVKIRSDGTRYVAKRPVRDRLLKARAMKIREERSGMTTDDDAVSEMKMGRYWSKEERKQQLLKAREQRRRREFMIQSRLDYLRDHGLDVGKDSQSESGQNSASILELSQKKSSKKRNRRILDNWITIQELLAHGSRSPDGTKVYNPLLSVTTV